MKTISILLALVNAMFAGLLLVYTFSATDVHNSNSLWLVTKSAAALLVILIGGLTWLAGMNTIRSGPLLIGGLALVVMGAVTIVWTYHLAVLSGSIEYYMILFGGSLMAQGMASLLGFGVERENTTSPLVQ